VVELVRLLRDLFKQQALNVVFKGQSLIDGQQSVHFAEGGIFRSWLNILKNLHLDKLLITAKQTLPQRTPTEAAEEDDVVFRLDPNASRLKKWVVRLLSEKLKFLNIALYWIFSIRPVYYLMFAVWMVLSPIAAKYDLGPIYILGTIFALIVFNLGVRREGELSAYSIFNRNVERLPGQLDADQIDREIRQGRM